MRNRALLFSALMFVFACPPAEEKTPPPAAQPPPPSPPPPAPPPAAQPPSTQTGTSAAGPSTTAGQRLYMRGCVACHGMDGSGAQMKQILPEIKDLAAADLQTKLTDAQIREVILKGRGKMPPFEPVFKSEEIDSIVLYLRSLKK